MSYEARIIIVFRMIIALVFACASCYMAIENIDGWVWILIASIMFCASIDKDKE